MKTVQSYFIFLLLTCSACQQNDKPEQIKPVIIHVEKETDIHKEVSGIIKNYLQQVDTSLVMVMEGDSLFATKFIADFYSQNDHSSVWFDKKNANKSADTLLNIIKNSSDYGLIANDYHREKIDSLLKFQKPGAQKNIDAGALSKAEILMTDAFFTFCVHVHKGRLNKDSLTREWKGKEIKFDLPCLLDSALRNNIITSVIDSLEPENKEYRSLKLALKNFRTEFEGVDWDNLYYESEDSTTFDQRLKKRLIASHDYYDWYYGKEQQKLITALKNFQCRHCLKEDGKVGKLTYRALQATKQDCIRKIELNMERWRWYGSPKETAYCFVNIPKYEMRVVEDDSIILTSKVIVGAPKTPSPILKSKISYMLIYPYWNVPKKIAVKEILPILKRDPNYLARNNFEVLNHRNQVMTEPINWKKYNEDYFPYRFRQRIGDDNSLGILKFHFYNKYGVYMHDTNNKTLFSKEERALSHGCIRVEKFIDFALYLILPDSAKYAANDFKYDILQEKQKKFYFKRQLPVYINYFTAESPDNCQLRFFIDIYGRDEKMSKSLYIN